MRTSTAAAVLGVVSLAGLVSLAALRGSWTSVRGDEGTYLAMASSLARDGDLLFDERDRSRLAERPTNGGATLILQRTAAGVSYSKPVLLALVAAPLYLLLGEAGLLVLNALALAAALVLAWAYLRRLGSAADAALAVVTFAGAGALLPYLGWKMSDLLQVAFTLAGLVLALGEGPVPAAGATRGRGGGLFAARWAPWAGGLLLGAAVTLRFPNLLVALAPVAALALDGRRRRAAKVLVAGGVAFLIVSGVGLALTGTANPYKTVRASFTPETGYPVGEGSAAQREFVDHVKTQSMTWYPRLEPAVSLYASLYFFVGRHTGLLIYFPAALVFLLFTLRRLDRRAAVLLAAAAGLALFYLLWQPRNYFGGASFVGNRYFLSAYPLFLAALPALPRRRTLAWAWALALPVFASALLSTWSLRGGDPGSQSHAHAGLFRLLPYESTAALVEGRRDRYWRDDFVRFVDPFAEARQESFELTAGEAAAELLVASRRPEGRLLFRVDARPGPELELEVSDRRGRRLVPLGGGGPTIFTVDAGTAWRRHPFWWSPEELYHAHSLRFRLLGPPGATAHLRYAGDAAALDGMFVPRVLSAPLPQAATAGGTTRLHLRLQNMSHVLWWRDGALPVRLGYRLLPESAAEPPLEGPRGPLPRDVASGEAFAAVLDVRWPERPGTYRLVVDLAAEGVGWFAEQVGEPVAQGLVEVLPAPAAEAR